MFPLAAVAQRWSPGGRNLSVMGRGMVLPSHPYVSHSQCPVHAECLRGALTFLHHADRVMQPFFFFFFSPKMVAFNCINLSLEYWNSCPFWSASLHKQMSLHLVALSRTMHVLCFPVKILTNYTRVKPGMVPPQQPKRGFSLLNQLSTPVGDQKRSLLYKDLPEGANVDRS